MRTLILALLMSLSSPTRADDVIKIIIQKEEKKASTRWTLSEWLATKEKMRLMDLWLALHSPSPYEFYLGGGEAFGTQNAFQGMFAAYASIFGLEGQYESLRSRWHALFNLRIFGYNVQATHITLQTGLRFQNDESSYRNFLLGVWSNIYIARFFGIEGLYRYYFDSTPSSASIVTSGSRWEVGAFLDFRCLRFFVDYFEEPEKRSSPSGTTESNRQGVIVGSKLFF